MTKTSTPITPEKLKKMGFVEFKHSPRIFRMKRLFLTHLGVAWQICDEEGFVGNEGNYRDIEEILARAKEQNLI